MRSVYTLLLKEYGTLNWWPAETPFEVMLGAILTQNTAWSNVEKAINNLKNKNLLDAEKLSNTDNSIIAEQIKPSGYYNIKTTRIKNFLHWYQQSGGYQKLLNLPTLDLRKQLLSVNGIGFETADDIMLYAFERRIFVIDAYYRRIFKRLGFIAGDEKYEVLRLQAETDFDGSVQEFNEYHALLVEHAKRHCKVKPLCEGCCLKEKCRYE
ncbi:MAG: endonuclease [Gammaproteobacteria bacterium]|nr:MAG: endonuclease [Gammaproteobacteria bacterium]